MPKNRERIVKSEVVTVKLTRRVRDRIRAYSIGDGLYMNEWIRLAILEKLNRLDGGAVPVAADSAADETTEVTHGA